MEHEISGSNDLILHWEIIGINIYYCFEYHDEI